VTLRDDRSDSRDMLGVCILACASSHVFGDKRVFDGGLFVCDK